MNYNTITVDDIVKFINSNPGLFPKGMRTPIMTSGFEWNRSAIKHEISYTKYDGSNIINLGYEEHDDVSNHCM